MMRLNLCEDVLLRLLLVSIGVVMEYATPFQRIIQAEEIWMYRNPLLTNYVPFTWVVACVVLLPVATQLLVQPWAGKSSVSSDTRAHFLSASMAFAITFFTTNTVKVLVGRPRPDYAFRCWPDSGTPDSPSAFDVSPFGGQDLQCSGQQWSLIEGRKSFPSGHSSVAFTCFTGEMLYVAGRLCAFSPSGRSACKTLICFLMMLVPTIVAISRTCDYHHHYTDVLAGSALGSFVAWLSYRTYYPPLLPTECTSGSCNSINNNVAWKVQTSAHPSISA